MRVRRPVPRPTLKPCPHSMTRFLAVLLLLTLAACSPDCQPVALKTWTPAEQRRMADEIDALPDGSLLVPAMNDYARLRREVR